MPQKMTPLAAPIATLEINDRHLPATMVVSRLRADMPRLAVLSVAPPRRWLPLAMLLMLAVPLVSVSRRVQAT